jgi:hypothetical protein
MLRCAAALVTTSTTIYNFINQFFVEFLFVKLRKTDSENKCFIKSVWYDTWHEEKHNLHIFTSIVWLFQRWKYLESLRMYIIIQFWFYSLLNVHPCIILKIKPNWCTVFLSMFISFLYMFRETMCPSSGETTVFMRPLVFVILCEWMSGMQGGFLHTRQSSTQNNNFQVSHKYSCFSWWWAHSRPKYVEKINKHTKKNCAQSWFYLQHYLVLLGSQKWSALKCDQAGAHLHANN